MDAAADLTHTCRVIPVETSLAVQIEETAVEIEIISFIFSGGMLKYFQYTLALQAPELFEHLYSRNG